MIIIQVTNKVFAVFFHQNKSFQILILSNIQIFLVNCTFMTVKFYFFRFHYCRTLKLSVLVSGSIICKGLNLSFLRQTTNKVFVIFFHQNKCCQVLLVFNISIILGNRSFRAVKFISFDFNIAKRYNCKCLFQEALYVIT